MAKNKKDIKNKSIFVSRTIIGWSFIIFFLVVLLAFGADLSTILPILMIVGGIFTLSNIKAFSSQENKNLKTNSDKPINADMQSEIETTPDENLKVNHKKNKSLRECRDCHKEVSKNAVSCPHCGSIAQVSKGCSQLILIFMFSIIIFVTYCSVKDNKPTSVSSDNSNSNVIEGNVSANKQYGEFNTDDLRCKQNGKRKSVWINTNSGTYALNGQAIEQYNNSVKMGTPLIGSDGKEWKIGRDFISPSILSSLIQEGLKNCR